MDHDPQRLEILIERLHRARLIREWERTPHGPRVRWNEGFRDGQGGREALCVVQDVIRALDRFPPLSIADLFEMSLLASPLLEADDGEEDL